MSRAPPPMHCLRPLVPWRGCSTRSRSGLQPEQPLRHRPESQILQKQPESGAQALFHRWGEADTEEAQPLTYPEKPQQVSSFPRMGPLSSPDKTVNLPSP